MPASPVAGCQARPQLRITPFLVAALLLGACAPETRFGIGGPPSACRVNAVLYCEVDAGADGPAERCTCIASGRVRDVLPGLSRP
jgi:hypothetical protein